METDWNKHVVIDEADDAWVPLKVVEQIMVENEQLRETLYATQNYHHSRVLNKMYQCFGHSTSQIIKIADNIEQYTKGVIKAQDAFRLIYLGIESNYGIGFDMRRKGESKLQYGWRIGMLPIIAMNMNALLGIVMSVYRIDTNSSVKFYTALKAKMDAKIKQRYKLNSTLNKP
jgi:hypothetical protein